MSQDGSWVEEPKQSVNVADEPPCTFDVQITHEHQMEFEFDLAGHVSKVTCSCGAEGTMEML